jgi:hypothetical protein
MIAIDQYLEELCPLKEFYSFLDFFLSAYRYSFDIRYIALPYLDTDQVWVWFWSIDFFHEVMALGLRKNHESSVFRTFFLSAYR